MPKGGGEQGRFRGALLGLACGDAVGTAAEFRPRGSFPPVTDMTGGGPFNLAPGQWTDDTSMALCLAESLLEKGRFDAADQMRRYLLWRDEGHLSSNGRCFDIGSTVADALGRFRKTGDPFSGSTDPLAAGNGCIMRLAPVPMFFYPDRQEAIRWSAESSRTTHGAPECLEACRLLSEILFRALDGRSQPEILEGLDDGSFRTPAVAAIARGEYRRKTADMIRGSGHVSACLEAALWCFTLTGSFEGAVLAAANLGEDADTTAAVCGQVAGACYGESGIPRRWLDRLAMGDAIAAFADRLREADSSRR